MRLFLLALFVLASIQPGFTATPNYLNDQAMFQKGWSQLVEKFGSDIDVA